MIRSALLLSGKGALALAAFALVAWAGYGFVLYLMQDRLLFPAPGGIGRDSLDAAAAETGAQVLSLTATDGVGVYAWSLRSGSDRLVIYLHGNGEAVTDTTPLHRSLLRKGWDVLVPAYRGYPGSDPVVPTEEGLALDAQAAWDWAVGPGGYRADRIVIHGRSLGGAVGAMLVDGDANPAGLVLESTFTSIDAVAARTAPLYPVAMLLRNHFRTWERAPRLGVPVLVLHSSGDQLIPLELSAVQLAPRIAEVEVHQTTGWGHDRLLTIVDPQLGAAYFAFLERMAPRGR